MVQIEDAKHGDLIGLVMNPIYSSSDIAFAIRLEKDLQCLVLFVTKVSQRKSLARKKVWKVLVCAGNFPMGKCNYLSADLIQFLH